jgi:hypothetical protein
MASEKFNHDKVIDGKLFVSPLPANRVVYTGASGELKTDPDFGYDDTTDTMSVTNFQITNLIWPTLRMLNTGAGTLEFDDKFNGIGNSLNQIYKRSTSAMSPTGTERVTVRVVEDFVQGDSATNTSHDGLYQIYLSDKDGEYLGLEMKVVSGAIVTTINGLTSSGSLSAISAGHLVWDTTNSRLGFKNSGTATPEVPVHLVVVDGAAIATVTGAPTQFLFDGTITTVPTSPNHRVCQVAGTVNFSTAPTSAKNLIACHYLMQTAANATDLSLVTLRGAQSASTHNGSGSILNVYGGHQQANRVGTGNVLGTLGGHSFQIANNAASGSVQQGTAIHVLTPTHTAGATIVDLAGLTIEDQTPSAGAVTNRRAINQKGTTDINLFNGPVTIANATSTAVTQAASDVSTKLATTGFVDSRDSTLYVGAVVVNDSAYATANRVAIQAAINTACASTSRVVVRLPAGTIYIDKPLWIWSGYVGLRGGPNYSTNLFPLWGSGFCIHLLSDEHIMPTLGTSLATGSGGALPIGTAKCYASFWECMALGEMYSATAYTIRYFIKVTSSSLGWHYYWGSEFASLRRCVALLQTNDAGLTLYYWDSTLNSGAGGQATASSAAGVISYNTVYHVATTWSGSTLKVWLGQPGGTSTAIISVSYSGANPFRPRGYDCLSIGYDPPHGGMSGGTVFNGPEGWIDSFQVTRDCKYTANFTAPTAKHSDSGDNTSAVLQNFVVDSDVPRCWLGHSQYAVSLAMAGGYYQLPMGVSNDIYQMGLNEVRDIFFTGAFGASALISNDTPHSHHINLTSNACYIGFAYVGATYGTQRDSVDGNTVSFTMALLEQAMQCDTKNGNLISNSIALVCDGAVSGSNNNLNIAPLSGSLANMFVSGGNGMVFIHCQVDDEGQSSAMIENVIISGDDAGALFIGGLLVSETAPQLVHCRKGGTVQMFGVNALTGTSVTKWVKFDDAPSNKAVLKGRTDYGAHHVPITDHPEWMEYDDEGFAYNVPNIISNGYCVGNITARVSTFTDGATISVNAATAEIFEGTITAASRVFIAPTNPSQKAIKLRIRIGPSGSPTYSFSRAAFRFPLDTEPTHSTVASRTDTYMFEWNAGAGAWDYCWSTIGEYPDFPSLYVGLKGRWKMENVNDETANANNLTNTNTVTFTSGKIGNAATFTTASAQQLSHASNATLQVGGHDWTMVGWVKFTTSGLYGVVAKADFSVPEFYLFGRPDAGTWLSTVWNGSGYQSIPNITGCTTGTWYMYAIRYNNTTKQYQVSINLGTPSSVTMTTAMPAGSGPLKFSHNESGYDYLTGQHDDAALWDRWLTDGELAIIYNSGSARDW